MPSYFLFIKCNIAYFKQKEKLTTYKAADFTPNDELVVAARHTYLCIWNAATVNPLRLLHSSLSPVTKLFTSPAVNKAITLLEDNSIQVLLDVKERVVFLMVNAFIPINQKLVSKNSSPNKKKKFIEKEAAL